MSDKKTSRFSILLLLRCSCTKKELETSSPLTLDTIPKSIPLFFLSLRVCWSEIEREKLLWQFYTMILW